MNSCLKLMKKHELLEEDVRQHRDALETMYTLSKTFFDANHFDRDTIRARQDTLQKRYVNLKVSHQVTKVKGGQNSWTTFKDKTALFLICRLKVRGGQKFKLSSKTAQHFEFLKISHKGWREKSNYWIIFPGAKLKQIPFANVMVTMSWKGMKRGRKIIY